MTYVGVLANASEQPYRFINGRCLPLIIFSLFNINQYDTWISSSVQNQLSVNLN